MLYYFQFCKYKLKYNKELNAFIYYLKHFLRKRNPGNIIKEYKNEKDKINKDLLKKKTKRNDKEVTIFDKKERINNIYSDYSFI